MSLVLNRERSDDVPMTTVHLGRLALTKPALTPPALAALYRSFRGRPRRLPVRTGYDTRRPTL